MYWFHPNVDNNGGVNGSSPMGRAIEHVLSLNSADVK